VIYSPNPIKLRKLTTGSSSLSGAI